jgi:methylenetetrahydrofolate dehydrogenase (NADP+) / methenyltetrahydrofolate cyclohydrolase
MILSGKGVADQIQEEIAEEVGRLSSPPCLAIVLTGDNPSSQSYVLAKRKACEKVGIKAEFYQLPVDTSESTLIALIHKLNEDSSVDGILVQLPLPNVIRAEEVVAAIDPEKDIDGFHPTNLGKLLLGHSGGFIPCTPLGIKTLLERSNIDVVGQDVVIVGRSNIVGKPLAALLMQNAPGANATVTLVHSRTPNLKKHTLRADILVVAIGSPRFITADMVKEGAVVIDVGINREHDKIVGDVDFNTVAPKCRAITPVPKGVGPMTVAMLLYNTLQARLKKL